MKFNTNVGGVTVLFGSGTLADADLLQKSFADRGVTRVVLVTTESGDRRYGNLVRKALGDLVVGTWKNAQPHVPQELVDALKGTATDVNADCLLALGGGSTIGVCKGVALQDERDIIVAAVPTTYSGSEMTNIWGVHKDGHKTTGRSEAVRPNIVVYDPSLLTSLPAANAIPSLFNGLAHCVAALQDNTAGPMISMIAEQGVKTICKAVHAITEPNLNDMERNAAVETALYGAFLAGQALAAKMGLHHKAAHVVGGTFGAPHAEVHTALLPHTIHFNAEAMPDAMEVIARGMGLSSAADIADPSEAVFQLIRKCGAETQLRRLDLTLHNMLEAADILLESWNKAYYDNAREVDLVAVRTLLSNALHGRRPGAEFRLEAGDIWGPRDLPSAGAVEQSGHDVSHMQIDVLPVAASGCKVEDAAVVIVGVHGRFASAERIIEMADETMLTGLTRAQRARVALVAPQAANCSWYPESAFVDLEQNQPDLDAAVERLATILDDLRNRGVSPQRIVVFGFSQGACLALETVLRVSGRVQSAPCAAVVAYAGALIGPGVEPATDYSVCHNKAGPMEAGSGTAPEGQLPLTGIRFELGVADKDPHVPIARTRATAALLRRFGALDVGERYFSGEGIEHHRITEDQQAAAVATFQAVFQGVVAADLSSTSSGVPVSHPQSLGFGGMALSSSFLAAPAYLAGFWTPLQSTALPGALPTGFNQPARSPYGLYNECINGTSFVAPRAVNYRCWFYRLRPSVASQTPLVPLHSFAAPLFVGDYSPTAGLCSPTPEPLRFKGIPVPAASTEELTFVSGLATLGGCGSPLARSGWAVHWFRVNTSMQDESFYNSDGDLLIVPEQGVLRVRTECGLLEVAPGECMVLPQGMKMTVELKDGHASSRGWVAEIFEGHFSLPNRGPFGSNGLSDPRDFLAAVAAFEERSCTHRIVAKFAGALFESSMDHSPYNVVAWHGNYYPVKFSFDSFNPATSALRDHPDPSTHTVLNVPLNDANSLVDFVVFKGRYDIGEESFRPPYYHRNRATEFNAIVKIDEPYSGFDAGVCFLTPMMTPHGVSAASTEGFNAAVQAGDPKINRPKRLSDDSIWIMFESCAQLCVTNWAASNTSFRDVAYRDFWKGLGRLTSAGTLPGGRIVGGPPGFH